MRPALLEPFSVAKSHGALKHVVLLGRGVRFVHVQSRAQVNHKALGGGQLAGGVPRQRVMKAWAAVSLGVLACISGWRFQGCL